MKAIGNARASGGDASSSAAPIQVSVDDDLCNEYSQWHGIIAGVFPFEFSLGVPESWKAGFPPHLRRRMLLYYTVLYERQPHFNFALFSAGQRQAVNQISSSMAKSSTFSFRKFQEAFSDRNVMADLHAAVENPNCPAAARIRRDIVPLIRNTSPKLAWSPSVLTYG